MTFDVVAMEQEDAVDLLVKLGAPGVERARRGGGRRIQNKPIRAVSLMVRPSLEVASLSLPEPWPVADGEDCLTLNLSEMRAGETLFLDFHLEIPELAELGHEDVIEIEARWTDIKTKRTESARTRIWVNIPEDEPGGEPVDYELKLNLSGPENPQPDSGAEADLPPSPDLP